VVQGAECVGEYGGLALHRRLRFRIDSLVAFHILVAWDPRDVQLECPPLPLQVAESLVEYLDKVLARLGPWVRGRTDGRLVVD
jgi:hypothetical protein